MAANASLKFVKRGGADLVLPINQLSRPKSVKYVCDICGKNAKLQSTECPSYYCSYEHFDIDWRGIKSLIAQDLVVLAEKPKLIGSEDDREKRNEELRVIRKELLDLCTETAQKFLVQGKYDLAVPGALQSLKFAIEIYGSESMELVSSYLLLAEANLGLRRLKVAEEFLSLANWNLLKQKGGEKNTTQLMSHLQRNFGRLYAAQQRYQESITAFAIDIYYSCLQHGPDHIRTAPSYFHMGRVFQSYQKKKDRTEGFYTKVVENCVGYLEKNHAEGDAGKGEQINQVEIEEGMEIVKHIEEYRQKEPGAGDVLEAQYCLGLLFFHVNDFWSAKHWLEAVAKGGDAAGPGGPTKMCVAKANAMLEAYKDAFSGVGPAQG